MMLSLRILLHQYLIYNYNLKYNFGIYIREA